MSIRDLFIVKEAGPFEVIPGGKHPDAPADPQGYLYSADEGKTPREQLLTSIDFVIAKLKEERDQINKASDDQLHSIALDMMDTASDLNWALKKVLDEE